jgi:hypothetical protein
LGIIRAMRLKRLQSNELVLRAAWRVVPKPGGFTEETAAAGQNSGAWWCTDCWVKWGAGRRRILR